MPKPTTLCNDECQNGTAVCPGKCDARGEAKAAIRGSINAAMSEAFGEVYETRALELDTYHRYTIAWTGHGDWLGGLVGYLFGDDDE